MRAPLIWIAWEKQRRTTELARALGAPLYRYLFQAPYPLRVLVVLAQTLIRLCLSRPRVLIVQNPSIVLAAFACAVRRTFGMKVVVDRHSNFKLSTLESRQMRYRIFHALSRYSTRAASWTIVTNDYLRELVEGWGGRAVVLRDKIPELGLTTPQPLGPGWHIVYICSFGSDEPIDVVIGAAQLLGNDATIHVTGDSARARAGVIDSAPENVKFTGFLTDDAYLSLLGSCDVVLTLTTQDHTIQCGAYEAVAAVKPLVFADHPEMTAYFYKGSVTTRIAPEPLAEALSVAWRDRDRLTRESADLRLELDRSWQRQFAVVRELVG